MNLKKKILCTLFVSSLAVVGIFGISTNLLAFSYTVTEMTEVSNWKNITQSIVEKYTKTDCTDADWWTHHVDVSKEEEGKEIFISASTSFGIFKAGTPFYLVDFRGCGDTTLTKIYGKDISSYAVPEPGTLITLGLILLSIIAIQRNRFKRSS